MLQETIIAVVIATALGFAGGAYVGHTATKKTYELQISQEREAAANALIAEQDKTLKQERKNATITTQLDGLAIEYANQRDKDAATIRSLLASRDGWVRSPCSGQDTTGASDSASGKPESEAQHGQLSGEFQEYLARELSRAEALKDYANVCYGYVEAVEQQRERMTDDGKSTGNDN